jgi:hypothetical protein
MKNIYEFCLARVVVGKLRSCDGGGVNAGVGILKMVGVFESLPSVRRLSEQHA